MKRNAAIKATAFVLCVLMLITAVISAIGMIGLFAGEFYTKPLELVRKDLLGGIMHRYSLGAVQNYHYAENNAVEKYAETKNLYFVIKNEEGNVVFDNAKGKKTVFSDLYHFTFREDIYSHEENPAETDTGVAFETVTDADAPQHFIQRGYEVTAYFPEEFSTVDELSFADGWIEFIYNMRHVIYIVGGSAVLLFVVLLVFLCCAAGWKKGAEKPLTNIIDKIPFDIFTAIYFAITCFAFIFFSEFRFEGFEFAISLICAIILGSILLVYYIYSLAARIKTGELFKNTVIYWVIKSIFRTVRFICRGIFKVLANLPIFAITIILLIALAIWSGILLLSDPYEIPIIIVFWVISGTIRAAFALYITNGLDRLKKGGERIAGGDYSHLIDTKYLPFALKKHASSLNSISGGMSYALEQRLKSEHFKTELITNVSHDLKTPLTSIVNYVDLLKAERASEVPDEERITEYIDILEKQSERLRKLTVDLVEASKASTGNMDVYPMPLELGELISQACGEYSERLTEVGLDLILHLPLEPIRIMADGKHLWRVLDNLMNNVVKYAMPGTRVYVDVFQKTERVYVVLKNTSKYELNVGAEELTERFVRGDSSRHTEGSGLGLSIARSLTELNGGSFDVYVDGDLFKVVCGFDVLKNPPKETKKEDFDNENIENT